MSTRRNPGRKSGAARDLVERVKELECLRGVASLFTEHGRHLEETLRDVAGFVVRGWQYPELACVRIRLMGLDVRTAGHEACSLRIAGPITVGHKPTGTLEVAYPAEASARRRPVFLKSEGELLRAVCVLLGTMVELRNASQTLERQAGKLRERRAALYRKNIALREVLDQLERDKRAAARRLRAAVDGILLPLVARLRRSSLSADARERYLSLLESHLSELAASSGERGVAGLAPRLSPREVEVADLVRSGTGTKEIADMLGVSEATVERHRHNIRRKLGISDPSVNLASFLSDL